MVMNYKSYSLKQFKMSQLEPNSFTPDEQIKQIRVRDVFGKKIPVEYLEQFRIVRLQLCTDIQEVRKQFGKTSLQASIEAAKNNYVLQCLKNLITYGYSWEKSFGHVNKNKEKFTELAMRCMRDLNKSGNINIKKNGLYHSLVMGMSCDEAVRIYESKLNPEELMQEQQQIAKPASNCQKRIIQKQIMKSSISTIDKKPNSLKTQQVGISQHDAEKIYISKLINIAESNKLVDIDDYKVFIHKMKQYLIDEKDNKVYDANNRTLIGIYNMSKDIIQLIPTSSTLNTTANELLADFVGATSQDLIVLDEKINIPTLATEDVVSLLNENGLKKYSQMFYENDIDGLVFESITIEDLVECGLSRMHARPIIKFRDGLINN